MLLGPSLLLIPSSKTTEAAPSSTEIPAKRWLAPTSAMPAAFHEEQGNSQKLHKPPESGRILLVRKDRSQEAPAWQKSSLQCRPAFDYLPSIWFPLKLGGADDDDEEETESQSNRTQPS